jgi:hypothetical protein
VRLPAPYDNDPQVRLWSKWTGTETQFRATGLFVPSQRFPMGKGRLEVPANVRRDDYRLLGGEITVTGPTAAWEIDCGPAMFAIAEKNGVEVVTYADELVYHGSLDALIAAGIPRERLPAGNRTAKRSPCEKIGEYKAKWVNRRHPDGLYVYRIETEAGVRRRREAAAAWEADYKAARLLATTQPGASSHANWRAGATHV